MLKLLLKKQFLQIFQVYFYDAKKNKARSKTSTAMYFVLFLLLVFGLLGGIFTFLAAKLCMPLIHAGMDWMYFGGGRDGVALFCTDGTDCCAVRCFRQRV